MNHNKARFLIIIFVTAFSIIACSTSNIQATPAPDSQIADMQNTMASMQSKLDQQQAGQTGPNNGVEQPTAYIAPTDIPATAVPALAAGTIMNNPKDGLNVIYIPDGTFTMGSDKDYTGFRNFCVTPQHKVTLDAYWINETEVTVAAFRKFIETTGYTTDAEDKRAGWIWSYEINDWEKNTSTDQHPTWQRPQGGKQNSTGIEDHPVVQVSWFDAKKYCEWAGGRLPTEAEWERAGRGDNDVRKYPWGYQDVDDNLLNFGDYSFDCRYCDYRMVDGYRYTAPVKTFPDGKSPFGLYDMAGNVFEWVQDSYDGTSCYPSNPVTNPVPPEGGDERIMRGGSYAEYDGLYWKLRVDNRWSRLPGSSFADVGFRCAFDNQP